MPMPLRAERRERSQGRWWSEYLKQAGYRLYDREVALPTNAEKAFVEDIRPSA